MLPRISANKDDLMRAIYTPHVAKKRRSPQCNPPSPPLEGRCPPSPPNSSKKLTQTPPLGGLKLTQAPPKGGQGRSSPPKGGSMRPSSSPKGMDVDDNVSLYLPSYGHGVRSAHTRFARHGLRTPDRETRCRPRSISWLATVGPTTETETPLHYGHGVRSYRRERLVSLAHGLRSFPFLSPSSASLRSRALRARARTHRPPFRGARASLPPLRGGSSKFQPPQGGGSSKFLARIWGGRGATSL